jgi:hypothetical protein
VATGERDEISQTAHALGATSFATEVRASGEDRYRGLGG